MSTVPAAAPRWSGAPVAKGHGTQNDFVLLPDDEGRHPLDPATVAWLADRNSGLGSDGVIRVVPSALSGIEGAQEQDEQGATWFMDYYNADGSLSEMCGNGVRVFAHFLLSTGRVPADATLVRVATRDGIKDVHRMTDPYDPESQEPWYSIDMGDWRLPGGGEGAADALVNTRGIEVARPGLSVDTGNPHTVVALASEQELAGADLRDAPAVEPVPPHGSNVEYIVIDPEDSAAGQGALRMRVHERGVGETRSCGTGACAAAIAARFWAGGQGLDDWRVEVPGGVLRVRIRGERVFLEGPANLVAEGVLL